MRVFFVFLLGQFICARVNYCVLCISSLLLFGFQYQCNRLSGKTRLRYDLLCVEWDFKPYTVTHYIHHFLTLNVTVPCEQY